MLSVGRRDGRRLSELGFVATEAVEMEDTELEEGEALSDYQDEEAGVNPDTDFSYLDDKLHEILGHFQKDFEGCVSAENLGAKFGAYGSFLPSYQRSPSILARPRSPPLPQSSITQRSNNEPLENGRHQNVLSVSESLSRKPTSGFLNSGSSMVPPQVDNLLKAETGISKAPSVGENSPKHEFLNKAPLASYQKPLKVRIKMGPDNALAKKNAAIYSGLGLDISPSSSMEDSHDGSADLSPNISGVAEESPMAIIQIMTNFLITGEEFLSPLHESLLNLPEKSTVFSKSSRRGRHDVSVLPTSERQPSKDSKRHGEKKVRSGNGNDLTSLLKVHIDIDTPEGKELVSNALKLPTLMEPKCMNGRSNGAISSKEVSRECSSTDTSHLSLRVKANVKESKGNMVWEDKKTGICKDVLREQKIEGKTSDIVAADVDFVKGIDDQIVALEESLKKAGMEDPLIISQGKEDSCPSKMRTKRNQFYGTESIESLQETSIPVASVQSKERKKGLQTRDNISESKGSQGKHTKELSKLSRESRYEGVEVEDRADLADTSCMVGPKVQRLEDKDTLAPSEKLKDKANSHKLGNMSELELHSKHPTDNVVSEAMPTSEAGALVAPPPVVIEEDWVGCDRCKKWRLLPCELNPDLLPKKWHCSMITWLAPGMNKCSISEEETTKALHALYQIPVPENQSLPNQLEGAALETASGNLQIHQQSHDPNIYPLPIGKKKKQTLSNNIANVPSRSMPMARPRAVKRNQQGVIKSKNINDVNQSSLDSSLANEPSIQFKGKQTDFNMEMVQLKPKDQKLLGERRDGKGKQSKSKSKRGSEHDSSKTAKKMKMDDSEVMGDGLQCGRESSRNLHSDNGLPVKSGRKTSQGLSAKDQKGSLLSALTSTGKKAKAEPANDEYKFQVEASEVNKLNSEDLASKKRKIKERQEREPHPGTPVDVNYAFANGGYYKEEMCGSERRKEKKIKMFKSEGKRNEEDHADKKGKVTTILLTGGRDSLTDTSEIEKRNYDAIDSLRKDLGNKIETSMAATSSSSKVSGSKKNKVNIKNIKGSPVESVSSSPLRGSASEKLTSGMRSVSCRKSDAANAGLSDCEEGGFGLSGNVKKEKESFAIRACNGVGKAAPSLVLEDMRGYHADYHENRYSTQISGRRSMDEPLLKRVDAIKSESFPLDGGNANLNDRHAGNASAASNFSEGELQDKNRDQDHLGLPSSSKCDNWASEYKVDRGSASHTRNKIQIDDGKHKVLGSFSEQGNTAKGNDLSPCRENLRNKVNSNSKNSVKKDATAKLSKEDRKSNGRRINEYGDLAASASLAKVHFDNSVNGKSILQHSPVRMQVEERTAYDKEERTEKSVSRGKPMLSGKKQETTSQSLLQGVPARSKGSRLDADASFSNAELQKQQKKPDMHAAVHSNILRHLTSNATAGREFDVPSPARKEHPQLAGNALKEAQDLKHTADRIKHTGGQEFEGVNIYFQAALKFLYGASLLEHLHVESAKHGEITQSMQVYSDTAKLCEYCAHEYERQKDMAAACLAYKCMEMAYMRVTYFKSFSASKDKSELQAALNMAPRGGSPSSSASDVDNANNQAAVDKTGPVKSLCPQAGGNYVSVACNRSNFVRLLSFTRDINSAMEALRKSQIAFAAANTNVENSTYGHEGISSVRKVLDFNVHDIDGMLHLVRVAMESISR